MNALLEPLVEVWREASRKLGFRVETPYVLRIGKKRVSVTAFLPEFGGPNGMVVDIWMPGLPDLTRDIHAAAAEADVFCSCINSETYSKYDRDVFVEALNDWGYFGKEESRPPWAQR